jgi:hypothetical protein
VPSVRVPDGGCRGLDRAGAPEGRYSRLTADDLTVVLTVNRDLSDGRQLSYQGPVGTLPRLLAPAGQKANTRGSAATQWRTTSVNGRRVHRG